MSEQDHECFTQEEPEHQGRAGTVVLVLLFMGLVAMVIYAFSFDGMEVRKHAQHRAIKEQVDHLQYLRLMANGSRAFYQKGEHIYKRYCITCHGADGNLSLAQARRLGKDPLRNIPYGPGAHPVSMFQSVSMGFQLMPPQTHLPIDERYAAIHYIREAIIKDQNPTQYVVVDTKMLEMFSVDTGKHRMNQTETEPQVDVHTKELEP